MSLFSHCPDGALLRGFAAGLLDPAAAETVRTHLAGCEPCRHYLQELPTAEATEDAPQRPTSGEPVTAGEAPTPEESEAGDSDSHSYLEFLRPSSNSQALGRIGAYDVLSVLGRGGMGVVLKAFDTSLYRTVAVKVLSPQLAASRKAQLRFLREARAAAGINHPNVVTIHAVDEQDGMPYLVMECVSGPTLRQRIRTQIPFDLTSLLRIGAQVTAGLAAAHRRGVIHRDIKPANIMLEDGSERVKITDFGLALVALDVSELTPVGNVLGTPAYMAPEQVAGQRIDARADLFGLGCVLYALVAGRSPFHGSHALDVARKVTDLVPPLLHTINPAVPPFLSDTVGRLLEKQPDRRYQSAAEVHDLLLSYLARLQQGITPEEIRAESRPPVQVRSSWRWRPVAAGIVLLGLFAGAFGIWQHHSRNQGGAATAPTGQGDQGPALLSGVLTVAQAGEARFRSLEEALAQAGPATTIRILDDGVYRGPFTIMDPVRQRGLTIESPRHALLQNADARDPVVFVGNTADVVLRGIRIHALDRQHAVSVLGRCEGLTIKDVQLTQEPASPYAVLVLWPGTGGSEARPIVLRNLDVQCGELGLAILGREDAPADWVRIENSRLSGPGFLVTLEKTVRDVRVTGNVFTRARRGVSLQMAVPHGCQRLTIAHNTFFQVAEWLGLSESDLEQTDVTIAHNLVLQADAVQTNGQDLTRVAGRWFRDNWWEPGPGADPGQVRLVAEPKENVALVSRDPSSPDFLRPAPHTMPAGPELQSYVGALAPAPPPKSSTQRP